MKGGQEERAHQERLPGGEDMQTDLEWIYTFQRICIIQETRIFFKFSSSLHSSPAFFILSWVITLASSYPSHCSHTDSWIFWLSFVPQGHLECSFLCLELSSTQICSYPFFKAQFICQFLKEAFL